MEMIAHNPKMARKSGDISPAQAAEYVSHNTGKMAYKNLPEKKNKFKHLSKIMK
jgi:hypothetical protein